MSEPTLCLPNIKCLSFYMTALMSIAITAFSMGMLITADPNSDKSLWISMLTMVWGVWVPQPQLKDRNTTLPTPTHTPLTEIVVQQ